MSIRQLSEQIRQGKLTCTELTEYCLALISGNPCMTIPAAVPEENSYEPVSYYLMAHAFHESVLIQISYTLEQALKLDCRPSWTKENICF